MRAYHRWLYHQILGRTVGFINSDRNVCPDTGNIKTGGTMAISLSKGQTISLAKSGGGITRLHLGLGWDPAVKKQGFLAKLLGGGGGGDIDLDASCIVYDSNKTAIDTIWFRQLKSTDGSIVHTGDNLTGAGDGDDEVIKVDVGAMNPAAAHLVFLVSSFRGQTFDEVDNAFCRILDDTNRSELCRYTLSEKGRHTGVVMGVLSRNGGGWDFKAVGAPADGRTAEDMAAAAVRHI
ncbi:MAG: tellurium resistance protein TerZ [Pseudorhodobacter sp.]|jgi:tellurium resistance protein TerZ